MKRLRIYADTSVLGGCFDPPFARDSRALVQMAVDGKAVVLLSALSAATALAGVHCLLAVPDAGVASLRPPRRAADIPLVLTGRTTDVVHPVRPRAPGRV